MRQFSEDMGRYRSNLSSKPVNPIKLVCCNFGLQALLAYRLDSWLRSLRPVPFLWPLILVLTPQVWILSVYVRLAYDIHLDNSADIGMGLYIGHFGGIHVQKCSIGSNCSIQQEVRIGPLQKGGKGPEIGNGVWIGTHAIIEGEVRIGDGATIGAGTVVKEDVPEGCLLMGNPARILKRNYDNSCIM